VPRLKPWQCGVTDHVLALATKLRDEFGIDSTFVVVNFTEPADVPFSRVDCTLETLSDTCRSLGASEGTPVLLHYSGYGYSADGAPVALANALHEMKAGGGFRLGVYFHEIFASGMPWQKAFWYSGRQKQVARRIGSEADFIATNMSRHVEWLKKEVLGGSAAKFRQMPVFSSVGETDAVRPLSERKPSMLVLGLPETRRRAYALIAKIPQALRDLGVEEIVDIGPEFDIPASAGGVIVRREGVLPTEELAEAISGSRFGFVPHPTFCLGKSSVFSSFCSLGTVPVVAEPFAGAMDGLRDGVHVVSPATARKATPSRLQEIGIAAWQWYSDHNTRSHAANYAELLMGCQPVSNLNQAELAEVALGQ
jgi:hypothetical protein